MAKLTRAQQDAQDKATAERLQQARKTAAAALAAVDSEIDRVTAERITRDDADLKARGQ